MVGWVIRTGAPGSAVGGGGVDTGRGRWTCRPRGSRIRYIGTQAALVVAQLVHGLSLLHFTLRLRQSSQLSWRLVMAWPFRWGRDLTGGLQCSIIGIIPNDWH